MKISITTTAEKLAELFADQYDQGSVKLCDILTDDEIPRITLGDEDRVACSPGAVGPNPVTITWETVE